MKTRELQKEAQIGEVELHQFVPLLRLKKPLKFTLQYYMAIRSTLSKKLLPPDFLIFFSGDKTFIFSITT